jgi:hypothetical protein
MNNSLIKVSLAMYRTIVGCVCLLIIASGCTRNKTQSYEINTSPKIPTQSEITYANYGKPITTEEFEHAVRSELKDPYSAHVSCSILEKGWYSDTIHVEGTEDIHYGYFSICKVNAKNGFGAYTGENVAIYKKGIGADGEYILKNEYLTFKMQLGVNILHIVK